MVASSAYLDCSPSARHWSCLGVFHDHVAPQCGADRGGAGLARCDAPVAAADPVDDQAADVGPGVQPAHAGQARRLDDVLERTARLDRKRTAPPPTVRLVTRCGALAARNSAAAVPTSGPTTCGAPRPHSSTRRARNA